MAWPGLIFLIAATWLVCLKAGATLDFDRLQQILAARFGPGHNALFSDWRQLLRNNQAKSEDEKLRLTNDFFNRRIAFDDDLSAWRQADYWATPLETMGNGRGDCEDFAIAKYYSLTQLGIPSAKLRLVYVRAEQNGPTGPLLQAHLVLAYYPTPDAEPLVLDNLDPEVRPASQRQDLSPIFSFNHSGIWHGTGNRASTSNLSRWQDLRARAGAEGFE